MVDIYRVLLTGIHLMRTGEVEENLVHLNEIFKLSYIPDLIVQMGTATLTGEELKRMVKNELKLSNLHHLMLLTPQRYS